MAKCLPHVLTVLVVILGCTIWWQSTQGFRAFTWETYRRIQIENRPVPVPNIQLENQSRQLFDLAFLRGKVLVINFIYTRCPTVCGLTGKAFSKLQTAIVQNGYQDSVRLLSISLDPQYDTPEKLNAYLQRFTKRLDNSWQVVRPTNLQQAKHLLNRLGVVSISDGQGGIIHNAATHIVDQRGQLVQIIDENQFETTLTSIENLLTKSEVGLKHVI
ncbi:MAG: SCO family protein [Thioalkalispiraceae bacterium]